MYVACLKIAFLTSTIKLQFHFWSRPLIEVDELVKLPMVSWNQKVLPHFSGMYNEGTVNRKQTPKCTRLNLTSYTDNNLLIPSRTNEQIFLKIRKIFEQGIEIANSCGIIVRTMEVEY